MRTESLEAIKLKIRRFFETDSSLLEKLEGKISKSEFSKIQGIRSNNGQEIIEYFVRQFNLESGQVYLYKQSEESAKYNKLKYMALKKIHMSTFIEFDYYDENLKPLEDESYERFYDNDLIKLFRLLSKKIITLLPDYHYVERSDGRGYYDLISPPKELTEDQKIWQSIAKKFEEVYYSENEKDGVLVSDQVKARGSSRYYSYEFRDFSPLLSWADAELKFKEMLSSDELKRIKISYKKEEYADWEEHDEETVHKQIIVSDINKISKDKYQYLYTFKKDFEGAGFSDSFNSMEELIKRYGDWIGVNWDDIKTATDKIKDYPDDHWDGWERSTPMLLKKAGEKGNKWGYNFYLIKSRKENSSYRDGGSVKSKGTFNSLGNTKELGIIPKTESHDMIAQCDCGGKFSYQNSKKNILWQCPECNGMKRIDAIKMDRGGGIGISGKCKATKKIKFKNGLNYFEGLTYRYEYSENAVAVSYDDGRFTTMSKEIFDNNFEKLT
jgi:hypothetical protein